MEGIDLKWEFVYPLLCIEQKPKKQKRNLSDWMILKKKLKSRFLSFIKLFILEQNSSMENTVVIYFLYLIAKHKRVKIIPTTVD